VLKLLPLFLALDTALLLHIHLQVQPHSRYQACTERALGNTLFQPFFHLLALAAAAILLLCRKGLQLDGSNPTLLYGYGEGSCCVTTLLC
jgi:hypothetical protein